jgi:hypothetical protein
MNRRFAILTGALVVSGLVAPGFGATAALAKAKPRPKPSCLMLTDTTGDAKIEGQGNNYPVDDIVSADIATGKKTVVGTLRLASGDTASGIPTGATYILEWTQTQKGAGGKMSTVRSAFFLYLYATGGVSGGFGTSTDPNFEPADSKEVTQATMDSKGVITWVLARKDAGVATGAKFSQLAASSRIADNFRTGVGSSDNGIRGSSESLDDATGTRTYTDMQSSCVRAT